MNTSTFTPHAAALPPPAPSRWLLVGGDAWRQALAQALQASTDPMLRWRVDFGLVQLLSPRQLDTAAREALLSGATLVHLFCEPDIRTDAFELLSRLLDDASSVQARAGGAEAPFGTLLHTLTQPDGLALARWLTGPRHRTGVRVYRPAGATGAATGQAAFLQRGDEALAHWLSDFLDGADDGLLDEIYGPPDLDALPDQAANPAAAPLRQAHPQTSQVHPRQGPTLLRAAAAASAAQHSPPASDGMPPDGCIRGSFGDPVDAGPRTHAPDARFRLQWPLDSMTGRLARQPRADVTVSLELDTAAWAGRRPSQLVLHPAGLALPVLVTIPATRLTTTVTMDRATFVQCAGTEAEFQLLEEPLARPRS